MQLVALLVLHSGLHPTTANASELSLIVSVPSSLAEGGMASNSLRLGIQDGATDFFDASLDVVALPSSTLLAAVQHPNYPAGQQALWWDRRSISLPQRWEIQVNSDQAATMTLSWSLPATTVNQCAPIAWAVRDLTNGRSVDFDTSHVTYSYSHQPGSARTFLVTATAATPLAPPPAPYNLWSPRQGRTSVYLSWSRPKDQTLSFHVYRETPMGWRRLTSLPLFGTSFVDTGVDPAQPMTYTATAVDSNGCESVFSAPVTVSPRQ